MSKKKRKKNQHPMASTNAAKVVNDTIPEEDCQIIYETPQEQAEFIEGLLKSGLLEEQILGEPSFLLHSAISDEEYQQMAVKELHDGGFTDEDIERWFVYDTVNRAFIPTPEYQDRIDKITRLREKERNLYLEAIEDGIGELFESKYIRELKVQREIALDFDNRVQKDYLDSSTIMQSDTEEAQRFFDEEGHRNRQVTLDMLGLHALPVNSDYTSYQYTLNSITYNTCEPLYHFEEFIGLFFDACYYEGPEATKQEHVDKLIEVALKNKIKLLLVYWEDDGNPVWEVYVHTIFVRKQSNPYSYDGFLFDEKKLKEMNELVRESTGAGVDIGKTQKLLLQRVVDASREIVNRKELNVRIEENIRQHGELADIVSAIQHKSCQLGAAIKKIHLNGEVDENSLHQCYQMLDSFSDELPQVTALDCKKKAREVYKTIYDRVSPSSQRYLVTSIALEEGLSPDNHDICPLYFELCRVFENELDIRIFTEYIQELKKLKKKEKKETVDVNEDIFRKIRDTVRKSSFSSIFIPEAMKLQSLTVLPEKSDDSSDYLKKLYALLEKKDCDFTRISDLDEYTENDNYVKTRNAHVHPNPDMNMETEFKNLEEFKKATIERLLWLIQSTTPQNNTSKE